MAKLTGKKIVRINNDKDMFKMEIDGEGRWYKLKEGKVRDFAVKVYKEDDIIDITFTGEVEGEQIITFIEGKGSGGNYKKKESGSSDDKASSPAKDSKTEPVATQSSYEKQTIIKATADIVVARSGKIDGDDLVKTIKEVYSALASASDSDEMKVS